MRTSEDHFWESLFSFRCGIQESNLGCWALSTSTFPPEPSCQPCLTLQKTSNNQNSCSSDNSHFAPAAPLRRSCWLHGCPPWALWCAACPQGHCPSLPFYSQQNQEIHKIPYHGLIFKHNQDFPVFCGHMSQLTCPNTS